MRNTRCWCYKCNRNVICTNELRCPFCNDDYLEIQNEQNENNNENGNRFTRLFNSILGWVGNIINRNANDSPHISVNDFFVGSEDQLQELIERLTRMDEGSTGSRPTNDGFIKGLKLVKFSESDCIEDSCTICLDQFEPDTEIVLLPCKHGYHKNCIEPWLRMHSECPSCRYKFPEVN